MKTNTLLNTYKPAVSEDDEDSWLLTYSDMMTLLLCFFVVLIGISNIDLVKLEMMTEHLTEKNDKMTMSELVKKIKEVVKTEKLEDKVDVQLTSKGVEISLKNMLLFSLGKAEIKDVSVAILAKISNIMNYKNIRQRKISVEGHTDSLKLRTGGEYPSNWELSSARAARVVRVFIGEGLDKRRFESIGFADTKPRINETHPVLGQPENRRVVVVISPESYLETSKRMEIDINQ